MVRSRFAITRLIVLPFGALILLYLLVVGGGGLWLYSQVRNAELTALLQRVTEQVKPLVERLGKGDALAQRDESWLQDDVNRLFVGIPSLRSVAVRGPAASYRFDAGADGPRAIEPLPADAGRARDDAPPSQRFDAEADEVFVIRFDLSDEAAPLVRLDFGFDRAMLVESLDREVARMRRAVILFAIAGGISILLALAITLYAMRVTRRIESHFQEIYQRATLTEMAASLVHDLRNPLMAMRANARALLVAPQDAPEIAEELDRDIVGLNDKLSAFLDLTRRHDREFEPVDVSELIAEVLRQARPGAEARGLVLRADLAADLPRPVWRAASIHDAVLNVVLNATQSGQRQGEIILRVRRCGEAIEIAVEDRGSGLGAADGKRLFEPFYTTRPDGNGLGLAIVQRVVKAHHGHVTMAERSGGGVRVTLTLPIQPKETPHWWNKLKNFPG